MSSITPAQVRHMAKLARLRLTDQEVERSVQELTSIIGFVDILREVDTEDVRPMTGMAGLESTLRNDTLRGAETSPEALLACSPLPIVQHQVETPAAHE